jgi:L-ascorbate metabolism protein UlaG (beta-lactamase superfamily)
MRTGDIDYAFLPTNGPLVDLPHRQPASPHPAVMSPAEAAAAAFILNARVAIPIHYDSINNPPIYTQTEDPAAAFLREAAALGVTARTAEPGEVIVDATPAAA